jgi:O-antigen/teichoic acid export membrane protein
MAGIKINISNTRTLNIGKQITYSFIFKAISIFIGFAYVPLLLNYLNQEKYGIWLTLTSILGWFSFFDIGLGNGLRNKLAEAIAKNDFVLGKKYVSTTYFLLLMIFGSLLLLFQLANRFINWNMILNTASVNRYDLYILTSIVFSFFLIRFIVQLIQVIYLANQKSSFSDLINTLGNFISFTVVYMLLKTTESGNIVLLGSVISVIPVLLFIVASVIAYSGKYKNISPSYRYVDLKHGKDLMGLGFRFFFLQICAIIVFSTSNFFIAQFYGAGEVAVYNIAYKLFQMPIMVYTIVLSPIWSAITNAYVHNDFNWLKSTIRRFNILSILFSAGIFILLILSSWIYKIWVGNSIVIPLKLSIVMAFYAILNVFVAPYSNFVNGTSKISLTMRLTGIGIVVYLLLIYLFRNIFGDATGVVLGIALTSIIGLVVQSIQTHKILNRTAKGIWNK